MTEPTVDETGMTTTSRTEIVVGLDEAPASSAALRWAAEYSVATGTPVRVVHAWQLTALGSAVLTAGGGEVLQAGTEDARARATRWVLDALGGDSARVRWSLDIGEGSPGPLLVDRAAGAQLLVLGTGEHTGLRRAVLGSVSHYCLSHSPVPVVAVPAPVAEPAGRRGSHHGMAAPPPLL